ncbi:MAG: molybdopterin molybdotransferase MoeA [Anaerolineae bacterium]|nr:molybdopterin molybdotransferase MoeA [Anaerolineae bacterium]
MTEPDAYPILSVEEARARILGMCVPLPSETVPILESLDRVLAEGIWADRDVPPQDNSAMDGYAVRAADLVAEPPIRLRVVAEVAAGHPTDAVIGPGEAARIMTGAFVPAGADTVVRFEDTTSGDGWVEVRRIPAPGRNVRHRGEDVQQGQLVLPPGTRVRPQEIGMMASLGRTRVAVHRRPRVAILATGDEIVPASEEPGPGQIRNINSYSNAAQVLRAGGLPILLGVASDRRDELSAALRRGLDARADLFITSGGVSVGDFDLVKQVLSAEGEMSFWWVNMKPGKPVAFGTLAGIPLLGLPGNPVSAMIAFELFARPAICRMLGLSVADPPSVRARLVSSIERKDGRRHYLRVRLHRQGEDCLAELTGDQGSGILSSMVAADGLAVIPEDCSYLPAGSFVQVILLE